MIDSVDISMHVIQPNAFVAAAAAKCLLLSAASSPQLSRPCVTVIAVYSDADIASQPVTSEQPKRFSWQRACDKTCVPHAGCYVSK